MKPRFEFEWALSNPDERGFVMVRERLVGTDLINHYGPMRNILANSFIRARRNFVARCMSRADALRVFDSRPELQALAEAQNKQRKARYDT